MKKRTKRDIIETAVPGLYGDKTSLERSNFVEFWVPANIFKRVRQWLDAGDGKELEVLTSEGRNFNGVPHRKVLILNKRAQSAYLDRGGGIHDNDPDKF